MADFRAHHKKANICASRPKYREARWERAVKVYTINMESKYLLIQGIPALDLTKDLLETFAIYGVIDEYRILDDYPAEEFTKTYWIKFQHIMAARKAKRKVDNRSFFGGVLHISYAPEFETVEETKEKLMGRKRIVKRKLNCTDKNVKGQKSIQHDLQTEQPGEQQSAQTKQPFRDQKTDFISFETSRTFSYGTHETESNEVTHTEVYDGDHYVPDRLPSLLPTHPYPSQVPTTSIAWNQVQLPANPQVRIPPAQTETRSQKMKFTPTSVKHSDVNDLKQEHCDSCFQRPGDFYPDMVMTGNSSLDRTVISIRDKLQRIKNTHPSLLNIKDTNPIERDSKRSLPESDSFSTKGKKKQRKRI